VEWDYANGSARYVESPELALSHLPTRNASAYIYDSGRPPMSHQTTRNETTRPVSDRDAAYGHQPVRGAGRGGGYGSPMDWGVGHGRGGGGPITVERDEGEETEVRWGPGRVRGRGSPMEWGGGQGRGGGGPINMPWGTRGGEEADIYGHGQGSYSSSVAHGSSSLSAGRGSSSSSTYYGGQRPYPNGFPHDGGDYDASIYSRK